MPEQEKDSKYNLSEELLYPAGKDKNSLMNIVIDEIEVKGEGATLRDAYTKAFDNMKTEVYKKFNNFIIHLEPLDVIEVNEDVDFKTKRSVGLFPHKKLRTMITLRIVVKVKYLNIV